MNYVHNIKCENLLSVELTRKWVYVIMNLRITEGIL